MAKLVQQFLHFRTLTSWVLDRAVVVLLPMPPGTQRLHLLQYRWPLREIGSLLRDSSGTIFHELKWLVDQIVLQGYGWRLADSLLKFVVT